MFKTEVYATPFTSEASDEMFQRISGGLVGSDVSLISTIRALVGPRIGENDTLTIQSFTRVRDFATLLSDVMMCREQFVIFNFRSAYYNSEDEIMDYIHRCEKMMTDMREPVSWTKIEKVTAFFNKQFYASCFVCPNQKTSVLLIKDMNVKELHYLQCGIMAYFPWYFSKEEGITELEKKLLESLREKTADNYMKTLEKLAEKYDFRRFKIEKYLNGFETNIEAIELRNCEEKYAEIMQYINDLNERISQNLREKRSLDARIAGLHDAIAKNGGRNDFMEFFLRTKCLVVESVGRDTVTYGVKACLDVPDKDLASSVINNRDSVIYTGRYFSADDMRNLFNAICIDEIVKLRLCAMYQIHLGGNISAIAHATYSHEYDGYTPNPHIQQHRCMGAYLSIINQIIAETGDYVQAVAQSIESCRSLNLNEWASMSPFISQINNNPDTRCIELPDGSVVSFKQAIKYLRGVYNDGEDN